MTLAEIKKAAELIGVSNKKAVSLRIIFLKSEIEHLAGKFLEMVEEEITQPPGINRAIASTIADDYRKRITDIAMQITTLRREESGAITKTKYSDAEIDRANETPMTCLIEFGRNGKAHAPCHDDRNPSMYYGARMNLAVCPVCDKKWNPVKWCVDQMGMSFPEAVEYLLGVCA